MKKAISELVTEFGLSNSLDQEIFIKGVMVGVETILEGVEPKYCRDWIETIIDNYFENPRILVIANKWLNFYYGKQAKIGLSNKSELLESVLVLKEKLKGSSLEKEVDFVVKKVIAKEKQIQVLSFRSITPIF